MQLNSFWFYFWTIGAWVAFFNVAFQILRRKIPVPSKIALEPSASRRQREFCSHVFSHLSLFHAVVNLAVSTYIYFSRSFYWLEVNQADTTHLLCFSAGYYLSNTLMGRLYRFHPLSMVCHHVVVLVEIFYTFFKGVYGNIVAVGFAIAEASNPFRIIKNIADGHLELKWLSDLSIKIFAAVFMVCRCPHQSLLFLGPPLVRPVQPHPAPPQDVRGRVVWANQGTSA